MIDLRLDTTPSDIYTVVKLLDDLYRIESVTGSVTTDAEGVYRWRRYIDNWLTTFKGNVVEPPDIHIWKINN